MPKAIRHLPGWACAAFGIWLGVTAEFWTQVQMFIVYAIVSLLYKLSSDRVLPIPDEMETFLYESGWFILPAGSVILSTTLVTSLWLESSTILVTIVAILATFMGLIVAIVGGTTLNDRLNL